MLGSLALSLLALIWPIARDVRGQSLASFWLLFGGVALLWLPSLALELFAARLSVPAWLARLVAWLTLGLSPALYVCFYLVPIRFEGMALLGFGALGLSLLGALVLVPWSRLAAMAREPGFASSVLLTCAALSILFVWPHLEEATLSQLNPGSERARSFAYLGTWGLSLLLAPALIVKSIDRLGAETSGLLRATACLVCLGIGVAALEADRRVMQDNYPALHAWLEVLGVVALEAACSLLAVAACRSWPRLAPTARALGGATLVLACVSGLVVATLPWLVGPMPGARGRMAKASFGPLILRVQGERAKVQLPRLEDHPLLHAPLFHAVDVPVRPRQILLITVDALRSDAVGARTPHLRSIAESGAWFPRSYSPGSRTAIGLSALMTGRYSAHLAWQIWSADARRMYLASSLTPEALKALGPKIGYTTFPDFKRHPTLATRMRRAGLRTMATPYLAEKAKWVRRGVGFEGGFDDYTEFHAQITGKHSSSRVVSKALAQSDRARGKRWFQWIHLFDPHRSSGNRARYRTLVEATDTAVGELVAGLERRGLWDSTAIMVTGDHGEGFGVHARSHGSTVYDDQTLVPLILRVPGLAPRRYDFPTSSLDGIATLLSLAGADLTGVDGMSLLPWLLDERAAPTRPVFTELHRYAKGPRTHDLKAVVLGTDKLIYDRLRGTLQLYDLRSDPRELHDVLETRPETARKLEAVLGAFVHSGEREFPLP